MTIAEKFFSKDPFENYDLSKKSNYVLLVEPNGGSYTCCKYDFLGRTLFVSGSGQGELVALPFSQLNQESLEFFRAKLIELGGTPPPLTANTAPTESSEAWIRMGDKGIAHVGVYPQAGRKLTDVFNFESRQYKTIDENLKTAVENHAQPVSFDGLPQAALEKALEEFTKAGGTADADFVLRGVEQLKKNKLS